MKTILVFRFSAMGDVAMTVPVLTQFAEQNSVNLVVLTRPKFDIFFQNIPNCQVITDDFKGGLFGLIKLFRKIKKEYAIDEVADLHGVLRSHVLRSLFKFSGIKTQKIDKGRKEKKEAVKNQHQQPTPLKPQFERYADVFRKLGYTLILDYTLRNFTAIEKDIVPRRIALAPFAKHPTKQMPLIELQNLLLLLKEQSNEVILFAGREFPEQVKEWVNQGLIIDDSLKMTLDEQMNYMKSCEVMVSMDSSNMHIASLLGMPVISVWGGTHPNVGFLGYGQSKDTIVQYTSLYCRPCSVYGKTNCYREDYACFQVTFPMQIVEKIRLIKAEI